MTTYNKDQEYTLKVVNTDNKIKEVKYTPDKDMSKPELIMALKSKYKNFFKLIESKQTNNELDEIAYEFVMNGDYTIKDMIEEYSDKYTVNEIKNAWEKADKKYKAELADFYKQKGIDTYVSYEEPYNGKPMTKAQWRTVYDKERENGDWNTFDDWWYDMTEKDMLVIKESIEDDNKKVKIVRKAIEDKLKQNGYNLTYDDVNLETDENGNIHVIDKLTNEEVLLVDQLMLKKFLYPDMIGKHREDKLNKLHSDIIYDFEEAYKDWGKEVSDTKAGFVNEYMSEFRNDFEEVNWRDYIVAIPEVDKIYAQYKDIEDWEIPEDTKWELYELITDYVQDYLKGVYSKKEESLNNDTSEDGSVIVISYGRGTRFPDRATAINYYKNAIAGTDPDSSENYSCRSILDMLVSTEEPIVYDWDDKTEYDWWVQKGKPTDEYLTEARDISADELEQLDEFTDNEIKKMYNKYCSENDNKKSFEEWQKENVDSALINELEYEFFSNRKKTEDLDVDEETFVNGFVGQPLSMVLTYIGDGHDIADKNYDSVVFFPPVDEIDDTDNYDLYVQGLSQVLKVVEKFDIDDINIIVDIADYVKKNKDTLLDLFEVDGETDEEIMEDLVCRVMPNVISGYTTDNVYKILLNTVRGGK